MADAKMAAYTVLDKVKIGLFGTTEGAWRDEMLRVYIDEVAAFMRDAGVPDHVIQSDVAYGCILMGVNDLWNYQGGSVKFSKYFEQRVIQLATGNGGGVK